MTQRAWTIEEIDFLKNNYKNNVASMKYISEQLNRSYRSVQQKTVKLGLTSKRQKLTTNDVKFILDNINTLSIEKLSEQLNVDSKTIRTVLKTHNVSNPRSVKMTSKAWSNEETQYLINNYHVKSYAILSDELNRSRKSIESKAIRLNLGHKGRPKQDISSAEILCRNLLSSLNLEFKTEVRIKNFYIDFMIDNVCIEVQGDYWHCNPKIYSTPVSNVQKRTIEKDARKKDYLESLGYTVIYLWEYDLIHNIELCEKLVRSALPPKNPVNCGKTLKLVKLQRNLKR